MIFSVVYLLARCLLGCLMVLVRREVPRLEQDGIIRAEYGLWAAARHAMQDEETELRAVSNSQYYGRFMMTPNPDARPPLQARLTAVTLAGLAGQALGARPPSQKHTDERAEDACVDQPITPCMHRGC